MKRTKKEIETKNRIDVLVYAYAYEKKNNPLVSDGEFDELALKINKKTKTNNNKIDRWFMKNFDPCTGSWINGFPWIEGIERVYNIKLKGLENGKK